VHLRKRRDRRLKRLALRSWKRGEDEEIAARSFGVGRLCRKEKSTATRAEEGDGKVVEVPRHRETDRKGPGGRKENLYDSGEPEGRL